MIRFFSITLLMIGWSAQLLGIELTPWDPWFFRKLERLELMKKLPAGVQLSTRPFEKSILGETSTSGWQKLRTRLELSGSTKWPYLENRRGAWITPGVNSMLRPESGWVSDHVSVWFEPRLRISENQESPETFTHQHPTVSKARRAPEETGKISKTEISRFNLLLSWSNLLLQAGVDTLRFGSGTRATLHWDIHAPPMPLLRIGTRRPWNTSWGYWSFSHQVGQLGKDRTVPHSRISGWRLGWSTEKRFEFGLSRSWVAGLGGDQYRFYTLVGELYDAGRFFKPFPDHDDSQEDYSGGDYRNQQLVMDGRLKFPETGTRIYWEWGREDHEHDVAGIQNRWQHSQAKIVGWHQQYGSEREWYSTIEWADTLQPESLLHWGWTAWYNHQLGWTYHDIILGHPMGADSRQASASVGKLSEKISWQLTHEERHSGVRNHKKNPAIPMETRRRLELDLEYKEASDSFRLLSCFDRLQNPGKAPVGELKGVMLSTAWERSW